MSKHEQEKVFRHVIQEWHLDPTDVYNTFQQYDGKMYSGIAVEYTLDDKLGKLTIYDNGGEGGIKREWHENGRIKEESLRWGCPHGYRIKWDSDGKVIYESIHIEASYIYEKKVNEKGEIEEYFDSRSLSGFRKLYYDGRMKRFKSVCPLAEKHFIDNGYINGILDIFEKYRAVEVEDDLLLQEVLKYSKEVNAQRYDKKLIFDRVVNEEELQLTEGSMYFDNEKYTGLSARILDDDNLSCTMMLGICGYKNGEKQGFELVWESEEILNPEGLKKYGYKEDGYCWWSKGLLKESYYYEAGELIEHYEWENGSV